MRLRITFLSEMLFPEILVFVGGDWRGSGALSFACEKEGWGDESNTTRGVPTAMVGEMTGRND